MRELKDLSWSEGTEAVTALLMRLTVLRGMLDDEPMAELKRCCEAVVEGDIRAAADACFKMTSALLTGSCRRVTGELFLDYLLDGLFLKPHPFAVMAAANRLDEALYNAMKDDMDVLYRLRGLTGETLYRYVQERYDELKRRAKPGKDPATRIAEAAWAGGSVKAAQEEHFSPMPTLPVFLPSGAPNWHYGDEELRDSYVSDEALEEMYHRFLGSEYDWSVMAEDIWNFFAAYGTGDFLKHRRFIWRNGRLLPLEDARLTPFEPLLETEYRACLSHAIEFMRGDSAEPLLLTGADGMGKTSMLFALTDELPEMRFVYVPECAGFAELTPLLETLSAQPLKFMVCLDDMTVRGFALRAVPANVLIAAASNGEGCSCASFTKRVALPQLRLDGFCEIVRRLLESEGVNLPRETVRAACVDRQMDSKAGLTVAEAVAVAEKLAVI